MAQSLLSPGKRLRPLLTLSISFQLGRTDLAALDAGCAFEMVHAGSLVMDDLPAMDNAELRRGMPTVHRAFGEDIAILTSIGLLNQAYMVIAACKTLEAPVRVDLTGVLAEAVGSNGLVGGQVMDLRLRSDSVTPGQLEDLNDRKTGALFVACARAGALIANADAAAMEAALSFARSLGAAFQIADDLLDDPTLAGQTGKDTSKDVAKPTLAKRLGRAESQRLLATHIETARTAVGRMGPADGPLSQYLDHCIAQFKH
jgi:geranylgeranyl diphosphate synthase type II